jgi:hypothetical protein
MQYMNLRIKDLTRAKSLYSFFVNIPSVKKVKELVGVVFKSIRVQMGYDRRDNQ